MTKEDRIRLGRGNRTTHGENKTRLHIIWTGMRARCRDKNNRKYGGRGIKVCKKWDESYVASGLTLATLLLTTTA